MTVPCAPLRELMVEAHFSKVTFLSLDVEGAELDFCSHFALWTAAFHFPSFSWRPRAMMGHVTLR